MTLKALIFDLDDTLLDSKRVRAGIERAIKNVARQHSLDEQVFLALNTKVWTKRWTAVAKDFETGKTSGRAVSLAVWEECLTQAGINGAKYAEAAYLETRAQELAAYQLFPDARAVMEHFRAKGIKLGLITNGAEDTQQPKIDKLGLAPLFDHLTISGVLGVAKPDPAIFTQMVDRLGVAPHEAAYVGDNPEKDVTGAKTAGLTAIWRDHGDRPICDPAPDFIIHRLAELKELPIFGSHI